jgi:Protein of unknown function (DUF669)
MADLSFYSSEGIDPMQTFEPLPPDRYSFVITETDIKSTKSGNGQYLLIVADVDGGEYAERKMWLRYNISNPSKQAEDIAKRELAALYGALGITHVTDSDELIGARFAADVVIDENKDTGQKGNRVKAYYAAEGAAPAPKGAQKAAPPAKAAAASAKKPWQRAA